MTQKIQHIANEFSALYCIYCPETVWFHGKDCDVSVSNRMNKI